MSQLYKVDNAWINADNIIYAVDYPEVEKVTVFFTGQGKFEFRGEARLEVLRILDFETTEIA